MAIYRLLQNSPMGPEEIRRLEAAAYEQALRTIGLKDRGDPITEMIAKKIIEIAQTGAGADFHARDQGNRHPVRPRRFAASR
jgi:hypothetical protein